MFAVPGWNVTAGSLVAERAKPSKEHANRSQQLSTGHDQDASNPKKRKRPLDSAQSRVKETTNIIPAPHHVSSKRNVQQANEASRNSTSTHDRKQVKKHRKGSRSDNITGANNEPIGRNRNTTSSSPSSHGARSTFSKDSSRPNEASGQDTAAAEAEEKKTSALPPIMPAPSNLTPLQAKMRAKLTSARFRHLNETLYTTSSADALQLFTNSPDLFTEYHLGFSQQVKDSWPQNPVDVYIKLIKSRGSITSPVSKSLPLPRRRPGTCTIADLGCGDALLAKGLANVVKPCHLKLHNFDLHAPNDRVTKADISALPLGNGHVDVAVFCLSLMGTNWLTFIEEAWRVLRGDGKGELWVAEVKSRFGRLSARQGSRVVENSVGKRRKPQATSDDEDAPQFAEAERDHHNPADEDDTDLQPFIDSIQRRGFMIREGSIDTANKMFVSMVFTKSGTPRAGKWKNTKWNGKEYQQIEEKKRKFHTGNKRMGEEGEIDEKDEGKLLKPCVYKLR